MEDKCNESWNAQVGIRKRKRNIGKETEYELLYNAHTYIEMEKFIESLLEKVIEEAWDDGHKAGCMMGRKVQFHIGKDKLKKLLVLE